MSRSSQNSSRTSAESSGEMPRRSASSSVSRCTSASGSARNTSLASCSPTATSRIAALRTPERFAAWRRRSPRRSRFSPPCSATASSSLFPLLGVNPALQQPRALRRFALEVRCYLLEDLLVRSRSGSTTAGSGGLNSLGAAALLRPAPGCLLWRFLSPSPARSRRGGWRAARQRPLPQTGPAATRRT